jgi:hypothetical protein
MISSSDRITRHGYFLQKEFISSFEPLVKMTTFPE